MKTESGFIAIMSVVIIGAVLMAVSFALSMSGFFARANITDGEFKERSFALAEGCADDALVKVAADTSYSPTNEMVTIGTGQCTIVSITGGSQKTIRTTAQVQGATTTIQVIANVTTLAISSWQELP